MADLKLAIRNKKIIDVLIRFDAYPDVHFKIGNNAMKSFPDQTELQKYLDVFPEDELKLIEPLNCISVKFNRNIDLEYYYFSFSEIKKLQGICQPLSHSHFFNILDFFSFVMDQDIHVSDDSLKWVEDCKLRWLIMFLVKHRTFYERYEFVNEQNHRALTELGSQNFMSFQCKSKRKCDFLKLHVQDLIEQSDPSPTVDEYVRKIKDSSATMSDIAMFIYLLCLEKNRIGEDPLFQEFMKYFHDILEDTLDIDSFDYIRAKSTIPYDFEFTPNDASGTEYILTIRTPLAAPVQTGSSKTKRKKTKNKTKKQFLYNPNNPKKSFDVYIDKNPKDTIPIKYTTVEDVQHTIDTLEKLYKTKKYSHKRIWQVGMIMYVRLKVLKRLKPQQYALARNYFLFLGKRTKLDEQSRYKLSFHHK
jgi:hypothetical protein